ncbi:MAG: hypothetical protein IJV94_02805 [Bacilli bacterium]|nr:hypothetical protein [Bacilli bacterium]
MPYGTSNTETFKRIMAEELINYLFASSGSSRWMTSITNQSQDNSFVWQINFNLSKGDISFEQNIFTEIETFNDLPELPTFNPDSEINENPYAGLNYKVAAQDIFGIQKERIYQCMLNSAGTAYEWVDLRLNAASTIVSNIFCQNEPLRKIINVRTEYQAALSSEQLTDAGWLIGAPAYSGTENQKLFARTKTIYNRHQLEEVSAPWEDSTWGGLILLQNNLNTATQTINDNLLHGTVRKTGDLIAVLDYNIGETRSDEKDENGNQTYGPKNVLIINSQGIGFSYNGLPISFYRAFGYASKISTSKDNILETSDTYYNEENINYSSTWTLDGTFNAENITVENLSATSIQDGILRLGNKTASGSLEFYDGQNLLLEITNSDNLHGLKFRHNNAKDVNNPHFTYISHDSTEAIRTETADGKPILNVDIENETVTTQNVRVHNSVQYDGIGIINLNHNGHKGLAIIVTDSTTGS